MNQIDILKDGYGYVCFTYTDGSKRVFRSSLNTKLLLADNAFPKDTELYDFDNKKMVPLDTNVTISITKEMPELEEVNKFASIYM